MVRLIFNTNKKLEENYKDTVHVLCNQENLNTVVAKK